MTWLLREVVQLFCDVQHFSKASITRKAIIEKVFAVLGRFCEAFSAVLVLNTVVFFTTTVLHFKNDNAFDLYYWGFVSDIMGLCAASGYKDAWGYACIDMF